MCLSLLGQTCQFSGALLACAQGSLPMILWVKCGTVVETTQNQHKTKQHALKVGNHCIYLEGPISSCSSIGFRTKAKTSYYRISDGGLGHLQAADRRVQKQKFQSILLCKVVSGQTQGHEHIGRMLPDYQGYKAIL